MMKYLLIFAIMIIAGCATTTYQPSSMEGNQCKMTCAERMSQCNGSSYTCDRSYGICIETCEAIYE